MSRSVLAEGDSGVGRGNLYVGLAVCDFLANLVIYAAGDELGEGADKGNLPGDGKACGGADHIGLGNAALDESLGEFSREGVHLEGAFEVGGKGDYSGISFSGSEEPCSESAAGVFLSCISIFCHNKNCSL